MFYLIVIFGRFPGLQLGLKHTVFPKRKPPPHPRPLSTAFIEKRPQYRNSFPERSRGEVEIDIRP
jgi:hypothetical protein